MLTVGVDEAGRGCAIGPLVIAGVAMKADSLGSLSEIGVKDSKLLTVKRREQLYREIKNLTSAITVFKIQPKSIDSVVNRGVRLKRLNYLEAIAMAKVIRDLKPDEAYVDASDVNEKRYAKIISKVLKIRPKLICEHKADLNYPIVSAASIIAKVERDESIAKLHQIFGDFGSGYCHDNVTINWLENFFKENDTHQDFIRYSWAPVKRMISLRHQRKLDTTRA